MLVHVDSNALTNVTKSMFNNTFKTSLQVNKIGRISLVWYENKRRVWT